VSIGSGISVEESGKIRPNRRSGQGNWKIILPAKVRKLVDTGIDMVASTLDCQREWEDAVRANPRLARRCHRLDVGIFDEKVPGLDEVHKMEELENLSNEYLAKNSATGHKYFNPYYRSAYQHLRVVARQLLAALFYFSHPLEDSSEHPKRITGVIYCRLPPSDGARDLIDSGPRFRLREHRISSPRSEVDHPIIHQIALTRTPEGRIFDPITLAAPVLFDISAGIWRRSIEVQLPQTGDPTWVAISGF